VEEGSGDKMIKGRIVVTLWLSDGLTAILDELEEKGFSDEEILEVRCVNGMPDLQGLFSKDVLELEG
jgi:hypothetical protein